MRFLKPMTLFFEAVRDQAGSLIVIFSLKSTGKHGQDAIALIPTTASCLSISRTSAAIAPLLIMVRRDIAGTPVHRDACEHFGCHDTARLCRPQSCGLPPLPDILRVIGSADCCIVLIASVVDRETRPWPALCTYGRHNRGAIHEYERLIAMVRHKQWEAVVPSHGERNYP